MLEWSRGVRLIAKMNATFPHRGYIDFNAEALNIALEKSVRVSTNATLLINTELDFL